MVTRPARISVGLCLIFAISSGYAANGTNIIGFGSESVSVAGADIPLTSDSNALNINPAGLAQVQGRSLDIDVSYIKTIPLTHTDAAGSSRDSGIGGTPIVTGGYARRLESLPLTFGVGVYGQGGSGMDFENMQTVFGTRDRLRNLFRIGSINFGVGYAVNDQISIGASLLALYADAKQDILPQTSIAAAPFFGFKLRDVSDTSLGYALGVHYQPTAGTTLGLAYKSQVEFKLDGGYLESNQTGAGLGIVRYQQARLSGLNKPEELGVGIRQTVSPTLDLVAELNWINWSKAVATTTIIAGNPDSPAVLPTLNINFENNWRDQYVLSAGFIYQVDPKLTWRGGVSYGRNPIPDENLTPLLVAITEYNLATGLSYRPQKNKRFDLTFEHAVPKTVTYTNPNSPLGPNTRAKLSLIGVHLSYSVQW